MSEYYRPFQEALIAEPQNLRDVFSAIDASNGKMDEQFMDCVLGIPRFNGLGKEFLEEGRTTYDQREFGGEFTYEGTPYSIIRDILQRIQPTKADTIYDIGSGYGRFCLYGALTTNATFKGIETIPERHKKAQRVKTKFQIPNVDFLNINATNADFSDGTIFYLFNPFYPAGVSAQSIVEDRMVNAAKDHPITVVTTSMPNRFPIAMEESFVKVDELGTKRVPIEIFRST